MLKEGGAPAYQEEKLSEGKTDCHEADFLKKILELFTFNRVWAQSVIFRMQCMQNFKRHRCLNVFATKGQSSKILSSDWGKKTEVGKGKELYAKMHLVSYYIKPLIIISNQFGNI